MEENGGIMPTLNIKGFPEDLYNLLVQQAKQDCRSLTGEVLYLLELALEAEQKKKRSILRMRGLGKKHWKNVDATEHINKEWDSWD